MIGIAMSVVCILMAIINIPGVMNGNNISIGACIFCGFAAFINLALGIKSL